MKGAGNSKDGRGGERDTNVTRIITQSKFGSSVLHWELKERSIKSGGNVLLGGMYLNNSSVIGIIPSVTYLLGLVIPSWFLRTLCVNSTDIVFFQLKHYPQSALAEKSLHKASL